MHIHCLKMSTSYSLYKVSEAQVSSHYSDDLSLHEVIP